MIEVTDEMAQAGMSEWESLGMGSTLRESLVLAYRAMRALEPVPPEPRNRQAPPPAKAGDPGMRPEDQARGFNPTEWGASQPGPFGTPYPQGTVQTVGPGQAFAAGTFPTDLQARVFEAPMEADIDRAHCHIGALTELVLAMVQRSKDFPIDDPIFQVLVAKFVTPPKPGEKR